MGRLRRECPCAPVLGSLRAVPGLCPRVPGTPLPAHSQCVCRPLSTVPWGVGVAWLRTPGPVGPRWEVGPSLVLLAVWVRQPQAGFGDTGLPAG